MSEKKETKLAREQPSQKCRFCHGTGFDHFSDAQCSWTCPTCKGTGKIFKRVPPGEAQQEKPQPESSSLLTQRDTVDSKLRYETGPVARIARMQTSLMAIRTHAVTISKSFNSNTIERCAKDIVALVDRVELGSSTALSKPKTSASLAQSTDARSKIQAWCDKIFDHKWLDPKCVETGCQSLFLKEARKDTERLEAIERFKIQIWLTKHGWTALQEGGEHVTRRTLREAIDAAMSSTPVKE